MSRLYDITKRVIGSSSLLEAEQILYGRDGIVINSNEYYKNIVSNFNRKKEIIIKKNKDSTGRTQLVFDLNNCNDLWNILFIYNYYIRYIDKKIDELNKEISNYTQDKSKLEAELEKLEIQDIHYQEKQELLNKINKNIEDLEEEKASYEEYKNNGLQTFSVELQNGQNIDEQLLNQYIEKLKEAINCIHKLRNSFAHKNEYLQIDKIVSINNKNNKFEISIPIEYLDGFAKGRIIAIGEDHILIEETNKIASPILEAMNFDLKRIESFFYNVDPAFLNLILEQINYDIQELYKLPTEIFSYKINTILFLEYGLDIYNISKLPLYAFMEVNKTIQLLNANIDIYNLPSNAIYYCENTLKLVNKNINIYKLPNSGFENYENVIEQILLGIDIYKLPENAFKCPTRIIKILKPYIDIYKLPNEAFDFLASIIVFLDKQIDIRKLPKTAFINPTGTIELLENNINIFKLPEEAFKYCTNTLELFSKNINIYELPGVAFEYPKETLQLLQNKVDISKLSESAIIYSDITIKLLHTKKDIYKIPEFIFKYPDNATELLNNGINIYELPEIAFMYPKSTIKLLNAKIDISKIPEEAFDYCNNTLELLKNNVNIYELPCGAFEYYKNIIKLLNAKIDISKIPYEAIAFSDNTLELLKDNIDIYKLPKTAFKYSIDQIKFLERKTNIYELPEEAFEHPIETVSLLNEQIDISKMPLSVICYYENAIKLLNAKIDISKIPETVLQHYNLKVTNLKKILEKVDYSQLNTLPAEFFECDIELLDEMFERYNSNVAKSIFGINNPKIIATLIYANTVLRNYNESLDTSSMDIHPSKMIGDSYMDNHDYRQNIEEHTGIPFSFHDFVEQFKLVDENNVVRSDDEVRKKLLTKIRNSSQHFRFKPVKDNNGNIIEDKIYIYDEDNSGRNNFNLIIDLETLVNIIREVEKEIERTEEEIRNSGKNKR